MTYNPKAIDTSAVELPEEIIELMERLAENTHEIWALKRISEGWTWGPERNDSRKEHPCLVPYNQLPESEKAYDRSVVEEILKAILTLDYRIEKMDGSPNRTFE